MNIIVCIKQVPDTTNIKIDPKTGQLQREGVPTIINPDDKHALEAAIGLKQEGKVTVLTMGPPQAESALREALAMGADEGILLSDKVFAGSDTIATSYVLAKAIEKIKNYDLIICGRQAIDGDTAQIGPQIAELLNLPQITYVQKITINEKSLTAERALEDGYELIEAQLPLLLTVVKEINKARYPALKGINESFKKNMSVWSAKDINADAEKAGFKGSPTWVKKVFAPEPKGQGKMVEGNSKEQAEKIAEMLKKW